MDFEAQRKSRMVALEEKRKKLEEMRKQREARITASSPAEDESKDSYALSHEHDHRPHRRLLLGWLGHAEAVRIHR